MSTITFSTIKDYAIRDFMHITSANYNTAALMLKQHDYQVEKAVDAYYTTLASQSSKSSSQSSSQSPYQSPEQVAEMDIARRKGEQAIFVAAFKARLTVDVGDAEAEEFLGQHDYNVDKAIDAFLMSRLGRKDISELKGDKHFCSLLKWNPPPFEDTEQSRVQSKAQWQSFEQRLQNEHMERHMGFGGRAKPKVSVSTFSKEPHKPLQADPSNAIAVEDVKDGDLEATMGGSVQIDPKDIMDVKEGEEYWWTKGATASSGANSEDTAMNDSTVVNKAASTTADKAMNVSPSTANASPSGSPSSESPNASPFITNLYRLCDSAIERLPQYQADEDKLWKYIETMLTSQACRAIFERHGTLRLFVGIDVQAAEEFKGQPEYLLVCSPDKQSRAFGDGRLKKRFVDFCMRLETHLAASADRANESGYLFRVLDCNNTKLHMDADGEWSWIGMAAMPNGQTHRECLNSTVAQHLQDLKIYHLSQMSTGFKTEAKRVFVDFERLWINTLQHQVVQLLTNQVDENDRGNGGSHAKPVVLQILLHAANGASGSSKSIGPKLCPSYHVCTQNIQLSKDLGILAMWIEELRAYTQLPVQCRYRSYIPVKDRAWHDSISDLSSSTNCTIAAHVVIAPKGWPKDLPLPLLFV